MNKTKTRPRLRWLLYGLAAALCLAVATVLVLLVLPHGAAPLPSEPTALPAATPAATARPTPSPTPLPSPTPEPTEELKARESIYYSFDPSLFAVDDRGRISYTGMGYTCLTGIDVSEHQYDINWSRVAGDGIDFAIIRTGYRGYGADGVLCEDKYFRQNMKGALEAGIPVGAYFFSQATSVREAKEEAAMVIEQLRDYDVSMPVAYDLEINDPAYRTYGLSRRTLYRCARAFCDAISEAGYTPMIYMTQYLGYQKYTLRELTDYRFWFAEYYVTYPTFIYDIEIWQYSDTGSVAGINGNVDMDVYLVPEGDA